MENRFGLETQQAARLAGVSPSVLHMARQRLGNWKGVVPSKLPNGRLLWPRDEVLRASGLVPEGESGPVDLRAWLAFLACAGLPVTDLALRAAGVRLLSHDADRGRDPAYAVDELTLLAGLVMAFGARLDVQFKSLTPADSRRALITVRFIVESLSGFLPPTAAEAGVVK